MPGPREQGAPQRLSDSGVALMNPRFDQDVLHPENRCIFNKVVDLSVQSINVSMLIGTESIGTIMHFTGRYSADSYDTVR